MVPVLGELAMAAALTALPSTVDTQTGPREWRATGRWERSFLAHRVAAGSSSFQAPSAQV